jgi:tetratricopeptide (TPR) repeat protein
VKKQILGTEVSEDIAYLFNELAVTYHGSDDLKNAVSCIKRQLAIWDQLKKSETMEYAQCLFFLGEMYRDLEQPAEAIPVLQMAIKKHEFAAERQGNIMVSGVLGID